MKWVFIPKRIDYDGSQLASHFAYKSASLVGDSIVAFVGACDVRPEFMVDVADLASGCEIASRQMLHFIVEHFDADLERAVLRQRLLASILQQAVNTRLRSNLIVGAKSDRFVRRDGDDLFVGDRKLTVSVATASPVSSLIHLGVNIDARGAPVAAIGLSELLPRECLEPLTTDVMVRYAAECEDIREARSLVRGVAEYDAGGR